MIEVRKVSETNTSITLGWDPVSGADGYRFYSKGILRSKTMDPNRKTVKFSKGQEPYKIEAVTLHHLDEGTYPASQQPQPTYKKVAPRTFNKVLPDGSDARFCVRDLPLNANGEPHDEVATYDVNGLCKDGRRTANTQVVGLRPANEMDDYGPCDLYPPLTRWPGNPQDNTGSWAI